MADGGAGAIRETTPLVAAELLSARTEFQFVCSKPLAKERSTPLNGAAPLPTDL